jgi:hypothetical protein
VKEFGQLPMTNRPLHVRKILVIGQTAKGALPASYASAFEQLGLEVCRFDPDAAAVRGRRFAQNRLAQRLLRRTIWDAVNRELLEVVRSVRPSLVLAVKGSFLHPETVREVRRLTGAPFFSYYPDNPYIGLPWDPREASALRRDLIEVLRQYDVVWMWEHSLIERLRRDRVEARYLPFAADPAFYRPQPDDEGLACAACGAEHQVAFVATYSRARRKELSAVRHHQVAIWGDHWPAGWRRAGAQHRTHDNAWCEQAAHIHARAPVSLNLLNTQSLEGHNMRTFEIPACGGVMLTRYTRVQDEFFPEDQAALYYRSAEELEDKLRWALGDRELRGRIRRQAALLAAPHTYKARAAALLGALGD